MAAQAGARYALAFWVDRAQFTTENGDLVILFDNGGRVVIQDLAASALAEVPPLFITSDGDVITAQELLVAGGMPGLGAEGIAQGILASENLAVLPGDKSFPEIDSLALKTDGSAGNDAAIILDAADPVLRARNPAETGNQDGSKSVTENGRRPSPLLRILTQTASQSPTTGRLKTALPCWAAPPAPAETPPARRKALLTATRLLHPKEGTAVTSPSARRFLISRCRSSAPAETARSLLIRRSMHSRTVATTDPIRWPEQQVTMRCSAEPSTTHWAVAATTMKARRHRLATPATPRHHGRSISPR